MLEVTIGKPLAQQAPKNTYRFSLEVMFGDADGEATNSFDRKDPTEFLPVIQALQKYSALEWNQQCDVQDSSAWSELLGFDEEPSWNSNDPAHEAFHTLMDLIPGDPCCDGQYMGAPRSWWISYFDANGNEHECSFTVDGKEVIQGRY